MQELKLSELAPGKAALRIAGRIADEIFQKGDPLTRLRDFESLWIRAEYGKGIETLGTLYDEVWIARSAGQSDAEIRKWVTATLKHFS